jgi:hypothetical protein
MSRDPFNLFDDEDDTPQTVAAQNPKYVDEYLKRRGDELFKTREAMHDSMNAESLEELFKTREDMRDSMNADSLDELIEELSAKSDELIREMGDIYALPLYKKNELEGKLMVADGNEEEEEEVVKKFLRTNPGPVLPTEFTRAVDETRKRLAEMGYGYTTLRSRKQKKSRTRRQKKTQRKGRKQKQSRSKK